MSRRLLLCCTAFLLPVGVRAQDAKSSRTVSVLERMDKRLDEVNQKLVTDLSELRAAQQDILQQLRRLDRLEQQNTEMQAKLATLEARIAAVESRRLEPDMLARATVDPVATTPSPPAVTGNDLKRMDAVIDKAVQGMKRAEERFDAAAGQAENRAETPVRINDRSAVHYVAYPVYYYYPVYAPYQSW